MKIKRFIRHIGRKANQLVNQALIEMPLFDQPYYSDVTEARIQHLKSLEMPLAGKSVIDVGCGIGRLSVFFTELGCDVFCVDGRLENIHKLRELYPSRKSAVVDLETNQILEFGTFDIVFCYGLLYHLSDPFGFLKNAYKICNEIMIIETCIMDADIPVLRLVEEDRSNMTQALHPMGCRPSPSYVTTCLKLCGFKYVYTPIKLPDHAQFQYERTNDFSYQKNGNLIRNVFIASHKEMKNCKLREC